MRFWGNSWREDTDMCLLPSSKYLWAMFRWSQTSLCFLISGMCVVSSLKDIVVWQSHFLLIRLGVCFTYTFNYICWFEAREENMPVSDYTNKGTFNVHLWLISFLFILEINCLCKGQVFRVLPYNQRDVWRDRSQILMNVFQSEGKYLQEAEVHCLEQVVKDFQRYSLKFE